MNSNNSLVVAVVSGNPFGDSFATDFEDAGLYGGQTTTSSMSNSKIAYKKKTIDVPILDTLPRLTSWSSQSSTSSTSTSSTFPSSVQEYFTAPIQWTNEDLMYLLTCLHPHSIHTSNMFFEPALQNLPTPPSPIHLRLFQKTTPPPDAFRKTLPIGTGRLQTRFLVATSGACATAHAARIHLAKDLFTSDIEYISYVYNKYKVLAALYASPATTLVSLQRGMIEMLGVEEDELDARYEYLDGVVDEECGLEARLEVYLLRVGRLEIEALVRNVDVARRMESWERGRWSEAYGVAGAFLGRAGDMFR